MNTFKYNIFIISICCLSLTGCAGFGKKLKAFLGGKPEIQGPPPSKYASAPKFSDNPNYLQGPNRNYQRMTQEKLENQSNLDASNGSLWVMEGQGAYLFSQNIMRMIGDPIAVAVEGEPKQQLSAKVGVIQKLLDKLEARRKIRDPAGAAKPQGPGKEQKDEKASGEDEEEEKEGAAQKTAGAAKDDPKELPFSVTNVPTRVVERLVDGNYRVKGSQPFMIGTQEFKVIVTGIVRAEDFNDEGISASQLLDSNFDIVSVKRKDSRL